MFDLTAVRELVASLRSIAAEQRITNLIVLSQISTDPAEKALLVREARARLDAHQPRPVPTTGRPTPTTPEDQR